MRLEGSSIHLRRLRTRLPFPELISRERQGQVGTLEVEGIPRANGTLGRELLLSIDSVSRNGLRRETSKSFKQRSDQETIQLVSERLGFVIMFQGRAPMERLTLESGRSLNL